MSDTARAKHIRVLVVDDHPVFRRGLLGILADAGDVAVVAAAGTGEEAIASVAEHHPEVVLLDLNLGDIDGIEVTKRLMAKHASLGVLILTMYEDEVALIAAIQAGARGYLLKGAAQDEILAGVRTVAAGGMMFGSTLAATIAGRLHASETNRPIKVLGLSERETEILGLIAEGRNNAEIARTLFLSDKTVRNHITNIFSKIGVSDRNAAIELGRRSGLRASSRDLPWESG